MNDDTQTDYVEYDHEEGKVHLTDDAPDHILEQAEEEPKRFEAVLNFALTAEQDEYITDLSEYHPLDGDELSEVHYTKVDAAVDRGDIDDAQEHKKFAELYQRYYRQYLYGWDDE